MYIFRFNDPRGGYTAWTIKHITSIQFKTSKKANTYGLPTKSANATQIFDMAGATQEISIDFVRYDYEEEVSNWDFIYTQNNIVNGKNYKGIEWYLSQLQVTRPYKLQIAYVDDGTGDSNDMIPTGIWNVSLTSIKYDLSSDKFGEGRFSMKFVERRP